MKIHQDGNGQPYVEWEQAPVDGGYKRAWIQRRADEKDWAKTGRYLNVVRCAGANNRTPAGSPTDFPIFDKNLSDAQVLRAFVHAACAVTGCALPDSDDNT